MHSRMCTQHIPQEHCNLSHTLCPQNFGFVFYMGGVNGNTSALPFLLVVKGFYLGALKTFEFFCEGPIKVTHYKEKTLSFGMCPKLINMYCKYL